jgi:beta-xylosidase
VSLDFEYVKFCRLLTGSFIKVGYYRKVRLLTGHISLNINFISLGIHDHQITVILYILQYILLTSVMKRFLTILYLLICCFPSIMGQPGYSDLENKNYRNPIVYADYSDPDIVKSGNDFFMTASSFNCIPALPILHSNDLVNWKIVNYAIKRLPDEDFNKPQHGNGIWAPAIRFHNGWFYIFYCDPDRGIYMVKTRDPLSDWQPPLLIKKAHGNIDPCPFWDDDGNAYLIHAFAYSRSGVKSILQIHRLAPDGSRVLDQGTIVFDGHLNHPTIEGPKLYKRHGYYYIFAPAGGVSTGWQTVLRSKNIYGPYEDKIVLHQGNTPINGPHQGGLIELDSGESWFIHFQDKETYGRIVHLQPVTWMDDWPLIGIDINGDGIGEPVEEYHQPFVNNKDPKVYLQTSDDFVSGQPGLQWQWHANPQEDWISVFPGQDHLRLNTIAIPETYINFWDLPNLLLQKFPAPAFTVTAKLSFYPGSEGDKTGLITMGTDYSYLAIELYSGFLFLSYTKCYNADQQGPEISGEKIRIMQNSMFLRVGVEENGICNYSFSLDGVDYHPVGEKFEAKPGKWIGAKTGIFCIRTNKDTMAPGYAEYEWFRIE